MRSQPWVLRIASAAHDSAAKILQSDLESLGPDYFAFKLLLGPERFLRLVPGLRNLVDPNEYWWIRSDEVEYYLVASLDLVSVCPTLEGVDVMRFDLLPMLRGRGADPEVHHLQSRRAFSPSQ